MRSSSRRTLRRGQVAAIALTSAMAVISGGLTSPAMAQPALIPTIPGFPASPAAPTAPAAPAPADSPAVQSPATPAGDAAKPFDWFYRGQTPSEEFDSGKEYSWWNEWGFSSNKHVCEKLSDGTEDCKIVRNPEDHNAGNLENSIMAQYSRSAGEYADISRTTKPFECQTLGKHMRDLAKQYGYVELPKCYGTFPEKKFPTSINDLISAHFVFPSFIKDAPQDQKLPIVLLGPGLFADPGLQDHMAELLAHHGFIGVPTSSSFNGFGEQFLAATIIADKANKDPNHPLHGRIDFSRLYMFGHSASGGSALGMNGVLEREMKRTIPELRVAGVVGMTPSVGDFNWHGLTGKAPTLFVEADMDHAAPFGLARWRYGLLDQPAWWTPVRGSRHNTEMDATYNTSESGLTLAFLRFLEGDKEAATWFIGDDWKLPKDKALYDVRRNAAADALEAAPQ